MSLSCSRLLINKLCPRLLLLTYIAFCSLFYFFYKHQLMCAGCSFWAGAFVFNYVWVMSSVTHSLTGLVNYPDWPGSEASIHLFLAAAGGSLARYKTYRHKDPLTQLTSHVYVCGSKMGSGRERCTSFSIQYLHLCVNEFKYSHWCVILKQNKCTEFTHYSPTLRFVHVCC